MQNFSQYIPDNYDWLEKYENELGEDKFREIDNWVYNALLNLKPGQYYNIATGIPENYQDLFVKLCWYFIQINEGYRFSDDFTKIYRLRKITMYGKETWTK